MSSKRRLVVSISVATIILVIGVLAITGCTQSNANKPPDKLFGSWSADIYIKEADMHFPALMTFMPDGSIIADDAPTGDTTQHGNWVMGNSGQVKATIVGLYQSPDGLYAGKFKVVFSLQRDAGKDTWSGPFVLTNYDASDGAVFNGTLTLTYIAVEELP